MVLDKNRIQFDMESKVFFVLIVKDNSFKQRDTSELIKYIIQDLVFWEWIEKLFILLST